jgi:S1-C subfamily serine protease
LYYNGTDEWSFAGGILKVDGVPVTRSTDLIKTLATLRNATKDETTLEGMRDALADAIGGLIQGLEHEIATQEISE